MHRCMAAEHEAGRRRASVTAPMFLVALVRSFRDMSSLVSIRFLCESIPWRIETASNKTYPPAQCCHASTTKQGHLWPADACSHNVRILHL
jgi:hypothetical protein